MNSRRLARRAEHMDVWSNPVGRAKQERVVYILMKEVEISKEPLELYKILKFEGMVSSGGEAKSVIADGQVLVNGKVETRKRKQISSGDIVEFGEDKIRIQLKRPDEI